MERETDWLDRLARRLRSVPEAAMRRSLAREALLAAPPDASGPALARAIEGPLRGAATVVDPVRDALLDVLSGRDPERALPYEVVRAIYEWASRTGHEALLRVLRSAGSAAGDALESAPGLPRDLADVPLGVRRSWARGDDPHRLEGLGHDPDPIVLRHLLDNPRTVEQDVLRIASRRPGRADVLVEIHRHPRWAGRPRVRVALARNPACPTDVATRALGGIPLPELRDLARDHTLSESLRRLAEVEIARRGG